MPQAVWTGTLSFGLVSIPVKLYGATSPRDVRFHQFEGRTGRRIRYRRVTTEQDTPLWQTPSDEPPAEPWRSEAAAIDVPERSGEPSEREDAEPLASRSPAATVDEPADEREEPRAVAFEEVVRGFEVDPGRFIPVTAEELEDLAPEPSRSIDIEDFVRLEEIDPVFFEKSYQVIPARGGEKTYRLLVRAMEQAGYVAIARFVLRTREHLAAVRPSGGYLTLETLFRADEVRDPSELGVRDGEEPSERELDIALRLIEVLATDWDPTRYPDTYRERVLEMIRGKAGPAPDLLPSTGEPGGAEPGVVDIMEALKKSVEDARKARRGDAKGSAETKRAPAPRRRRSG